MARKKKVESVAPEGLFETALTQLETELMASGRAKKTHDDDILNILSVLCDELHLRIGEIEPWRTIKQQIEALRK